MKKDYLYPCMERINIDATDLITTSKLLVVDDEGPYASDFSEWQIIT